MTQSDPGHDNAVAPYQMPYQIAGESVATPPTDSSDPSDLIDPTNITASPHCRRLSEEFFGTMQPDGACGCIHFTRSMHSAVYPLQYLISSHQLGDE